MATEVLFSGLISQTASGDSITAAITDANNRSGALDFTRYKEIIVFVQLKTLTGGAAPSLQVTIQTGDGQAGVAQNWAALHTPPAAWTATPSQYMTSAGSGTANPGSLGVYGRIAWAITGGPTGCAFYVTIYGKS